MTANGYDNLQKDLKKLLNEEGINAYVINVIE